jgi:hypothetical protein
MNCEGCERKRPPIYRNVKPACFVPPPRHNDPRRRFPRRRGVSRVSLPSAPPTRAISRTTGSFPTHTHCEALTTNSTFRENMPPPCSVQNGTPSKDVTQYRPPKRRAVALQLMSTFSESRTMDTVQKHVYCHYSLIVV